MTKSYNFLSQLLHKTISWMSPLLIMNWPQVPIQKQMEIMNSETQFPNINRKNQQKKSQQGAANNALNSPIEDVK